MKTPREMSNVATAVRSVSPLGVTEEVDDRPPETADPAIAAAVARARDQIDRKEFATEDEVQAVYRRAGL